MVQVEVSDQEEVDLVGLGLRVQRVEKGLGFSVWSLGILGLKSLRSRYLHDT